MLAKARYDTHLIPRILWQPTFRADLPPYDGHNIPAREWQNKVKAVQQANGWSDDFPIKVLPTSLSGKALDAYVDAEKSGGSLVDVIAASTGPTDFTSRDQYARQLEVALDASPFRCLPVEARQVTLRRQFIQGLPRDVRECLASQESLMTFQQSISMARRVMMTETSARPSRPRVW